MGRKVWGRGVSQVSLLQQDNSQKFIFPTKGELLHLLEEVAEQSRFVKDFIGLGIVYKPQAIMDVLNKVATRQTNK